jgi:hypothetical protein
MTLDDRVQALRLLVLVALKCAAMSVQPVAAQDLAFPLFSAPTTLRALWALRA